MHSAVVLFRQAASNLASGLRLDELTDDEITLITSAIIKQHLDMRFSAIASLLYDFQKPQSLNKNDKKEHSVK